MKLLGKEVLITNSKLLRFAKSKGKIDLGFFENMDIIDCMELICFCSDLTIAQLEKELDKDMEFAGELAKVVTESMDTGGQKKTIKKVSR